MICKYCRLETADYDKHLAHCPAVRIAFDDTYQLPAQSAGAVKLSHHTLHEKDRKLKDKEHKDV